jgi:kynurenine formamidase
VTVTPGDALLIYSGREAFLKADGAYGSAERPGLHPTCASFIRDHDVAILGWDMMDARPDGYGLRWPVHSVLFSYGVPLLDNALLEPLAAACAEEKRYEFMFVALPLRVPRGTGSPVNPIAMF